MGTDAGWLEIPAVKHGYGITEKALSNTISEILRRRAGQDAYLLEVFHNRTLTAESREAIRGIVSDELVEFGMGEDGEPNPHGLVLESAIDWLGRL